MMDFDEKSAIDIRLDEGETGNNQVVIKIKALAENELRLSSHEARVFATELIMAANRAEVRENLKRKEHLVRNTSTSGGNERRSVLQFVLQNNLMARPNWRG